MRLKIEAPTDWFLSRNHGIVYERSKNFETFPSCADTPMISPRPRKLRVWKENCPKKPS